MVCIQTDAEVEENKSSSVVVEVIIVIIRARISMKCHIFILTFFTCLIKYKHISDPFEYENTVLLVI